MHSYHRLCRGTGDNPLVVRRGGGGSSSRNAAHLLLYDIILYYVRVVHASIRHHVDLLKNSLYLVAAIFGGVESRREKNDRTEKKPNIYINILTSFRRAYIYIKRERCSIYRHCV